MRQPYLAWCLGFAVVALAPAGVRMLTWRMHGPQEIDPAMAQVGETLFKHEWTPRDPLANGGDGLGPVYNAKSCVACHIKGGLGGSGGLEHNVTTFTVQSNKIDTKPRQGVLHARAVKYQETLDQIQPGLPKVANPSLAMLVPLAGERVRPVSIGTTSSGEHCPPASIASERSRLIRFPPGVHISQRNTPALFGANLIDAIPDRDIIAVEKNQRLKWGLTPADTEKAPVGRALRLPGGRVGHFGWKAQSASLAEFVQAACANELGLGNPGQAQPRPLGKADYQPPGLDLTLEQCDQLTTFVASLPRPLERLPRDVSQSQAESGKKLFHSVGCADCHSPNIGSVEGIYSDLLLHRMGEPLQGGGSYNDPVPRPPSPEPAPSDDGPLGSEWRTPPLWGVADSAPYLHDGRAQTLQEAIQLHTGQGARGAQSFARLPKHEQEQLLGFLKTLRAP